MRLPHCSTVTLLLLAIHAHASWCPTLTNCGVHPACIIILSKSVTSPSKDACCTSTPTSLIPGPCPTCQTGCEVSLSTLCITSTSALPTSVAGITEQHHRALRAAEAEAQAAPSCYSTVINSDPIPTGTVQTVFPKTATKTSLLNGEGCGIVTKFLNGSGPASQYGVKISAAGKTTTVGAYSCM
ncbi:hypothetical protein WAI453_010643 [Rhynchosporium graminicola]